MEAEKIKLTIVGHFMATADEQIEELYPEEVNKEAVNELCSDICSLFANGHYDVKIRLIDEDGEIVVRRLARNDKNTLESLGFIAPCYAEPLTDEDAQVIDLEIAPGQVVKIKMPKEDRALKQMLYEVMAIKKDFDAQYRTKMTINVQHTDAELSSEAPDLEMIATNMPYGLCMYLAMHFDGKVEKAKHVATKYADGDTITLDEEWMERFKHRDYDTYWSQNQNHENNGDEQGIPEGALSFVEKIETIWSKE